MSSSIFQFSLNRFLYLSIVDSETVIPHIPEEGETKGVALQWLMENEAGSGPWLVKEQQEGIKTVFERWDDYYPLQKGRSF